MLKRLIFLLIIAVVISCSSDDSSGSNNSGDGFDRTALLTNMADNIIIPAFEDLATQLSAFDVARGNFVNEQTQDNLDALSTAWLNAYKVWQYVEQYNIGEAETIGSQERGFVSYFNIYPVSATEIDGFATSGTYDLTSTSADQGFPALDYLIHGVVDGDAMAIDKFTTNTNASGYITFMADVTSRMLSLNNQILNNWQNSYRATFIAATESSLNGSVDKMVNDFVFYYERGFRRQKLGTPSGVFSAGLTFPNSVEGNFKSDVSRTLALESLTAIENFFVGRAYNGTTTGASLESYLEFLNRSDVSSAITTQFSAVRTALNGLDENFSDEITNNNTQVLEAYAVLQAAVPLLKIDMFSALSIALDFNDNDGD